MAICTCGPEWRNPNCDLHGNHSLRCVVAEPKPYYRRAADLSEFIEIMGEHGEAEMCELLDAVMRGTASPSHVTQAEEHLRAWNAEIDEREAEDRKPD